MQQQTIEKLTALRQSIIDNIVPLMDSESLEPMDRFRLLSRLAQAQGKPEYYQKAFEAAGKLEGDDRLQSYMSLLDDVDYEIDTAAGTSGEEQPAESQEMPAAIREQAAESFPQQ